MADVNRFAVTFNEHHPSVAARDQDGITTEFFLNYSRRLVQPVIGIFFRIRHSQRFMMIRRYQGRRTIVGEIAKLGIDQHRHSFISERQHLAEDAGSDNAFVVIRNHKGVRILKGLLQ